MTNEQYESGSFASPDGLNGNAPVLADEMPAEHQMPLGVEGFAAGGDMTGLADEPSGSKLNSSAVILGIVLVCAGAVVFWMRSMSASNNTALASNTEMEAQIENFLETMIVTSDETESANNLIDALNEDRSSKQVTIDDVSKNPFILATEEAAPVTTDTGNQTNNTLAEWERNRESMRESIEKASKGIEVNSIMSGSNPLASLNGKLVRIGDIITSGSDNIKFLIEAIDTNSVSLVAESKEYELRLGYTITLRR